MTRFITGCLVLFTTLSMAQETQENFLIEKGTWSLEGDFSITTEKVEDLIIDDVVNDEFNFIILPKIGYAVSDNLLLGLGLGYEYSEGSFKSQEPSFDNEVESNAFIVFSYIKKFIPVGKKLAFHIQGEINYSQGNSDFNSNGFESKSKIKTFFIGARPGITYGLSKNLLIHANFGSLGYNNTRRESDGENTFENNFFEFNLRSSSLRFGFAVLL
ncbi:hypothetical protein [Ascidiimonas aurantiaca]|uniref:hypothetical protein n=1 Tax=Ascidiimonas aurantiaca TaxID=1685432 RepID=UPI0030EE6D9A